MNLIELGWNEYFAALFEPYRLEGLSPARVVAQHRDKCAASLEQSLALTTYLVPAIGYDRAASIARQAYASGKTIRETVLADQDLTEPERKALLQRLQPDKSWLGLT